MISPDDVLEIIAAESSLDRGKLTPDARLDQLGIASLDVVNVAFLLEDRFGVYLEPADFEGAETIDDVLKVVLAKAASTSAPAAGG